MAPVDSSRFSMIVPAHNEERYIARCLEAIRAAAAHAGCAVETVVVLNRCTDQTGPIAESLGARCVVEDRKCLAAIRNRGVRESTGEIIVTIDADSWMSQNALAEVQRLLQSGRYVGGGSMVLPERWSIGIVFSFLAVVPYVIGRGVSCGMFWLNRATFDAVGGFDETLVSVEDLDFALRVRRFGNARGLRYGKLRRAFITTSCRKFDQFGDWYLFRNPRLVRQIFTGRNREAADGFYYEVRR
jgi:glycosyltransferase involved in cell wall biosynthesis